MIWFIHSTNNLSRAYYVPAIKWRKKKQTSSLPSRSPCVRYESEMIEIWHKIFKKTKRGNGGQWTCTDAVEVGAVGTESVSKGHSMLIETAFFWIKIEFNLNHTLAMASYLWQFRVMSFVVVCNPKFTGMFLWFPLVYDCCRSYARDLHSPVHACASDSCFYWSKSVSVLQKEGRRHRSQIHTLRAAVNQGVLPSAFCVALKLQIATSVYESLYLYMPIFCVAHK